MTKTSAAPRPCNARHPTLAGVRCDRAPGHNGEHQAAGTRGAALGGEMWPRNPRGATPAQRAAGAASAVLTDLAAGFSHSAIAKRHGISRQRVGAIAAAAGQSGPKRSTKGLLSRLLELAALAGEDPADWLEDGARCIKACEEIAKDITEEREAGEQASWYLLDRVLALAIGPADPALAAQVRAVVDVVEVAEAPKV